MPDTHTPCLPPKPAAIPGPAWRFWFQLAVLLLTLAIGLQFYFFVSQAAGPGPVTVRRPPGVEGFLPIGGLMGWKLFALGGIWDPVHPAAMVILGWAGLVSLLLRKSFCGWFCPVGGLSEWLWKLGRRLLGRNFLLPKWADLGLRGIKYLLLGFFFWVIGRMNLEAILAFLQGPYYQVSDVKMLFFFTRMAPLTAGILAGLAVCSLLVKNFWCRYLCPYGALMGLLAMLGPSRVQRDREACIDCGRCAKACPNRLPVDRKARIKSPECSGCLECVAACPAPGALGFKARGLGGRSLKPAVVGLVLGVSFLAAVYGAELGGIWQSRLPLPHFRAALAHIDSPNLRHPSIGD